MVNDHFCMIFVRHSERYAQRNRRKWPNLDRPAPAAPTPPPRPACTNANANARVRSASRQSGAQTSPPRCGLPPPCLCSLPLSRAALRSSRSPPPASRCLHHGPTRSAGALEIPPPTAVLPLLEIHAPPGAPPSPPCAVCCSPGTPRAPCTNTPPKSPGRTSHSARAQSHAPEWLPPPLVKVQFGRQLRHNSGSFILESEPTSIQFLTGLNGLTSRKYTISIE